MNVTASQDKNLAALLPRPRLDGIAELEVESSRLGRFGNSRLTRQRGLDKQQIIALFALDFLAPGRVAKIASIGKKRAPLTLAVGRI